MNILGNQLKFGEYVGTANDKGGGGQPVDPNRTYLQIFFPILNIKGHKFI